MANLKKSIVVNGERVVVEMTDAEQAEFETSRANDEAVKAEKAAEKTAILAKLGLTAEEAAALLA
jgi:hypothetical protein